MEALSGTLAFICVVTWLIMGGWALQKIMDNPPKTKDGWGDAIVGILVMCIILAPLMFGVVIACEPSANKSGIDK